MQIEDTWSLLSIKRAERPQRDPGPGEALVQMRAATINYRDLLLAQGGYGHRGGQLPLVPVSDGAGHVVDVGPEVSRVRVGDLVCPTFAQTWLQGELEQSHLNGMLGGPLDGVMQEFMTIHEDGLIKAPEHLSAMESAALPCAALTAWNAVVESGGVGPGDTVVTQGTGGVSLFALQFAKMFGARVISLSSSEGRLAFARRLGADETINYRSTADWGKKIRALTDGNGADLIVEVGGAGTLEQSVRAVRVSGTICLIGVLAGAAGPVNFGPIVTQHIRLLGITVGSREMAERMFTAIQLHRMRPIVQSSGYGFEEVAQAIGCIAAGQHLGKLGVEFQ
jgi:NADPH:quinone reductase-like Zn-dependent oxidoreductase